VAQLDGVHTVDSKSRPASDSPVEPCRIISGEENHSIARAVGIWTDIRQGTAA
jgi:hypothetical protein